MNRDFGEKYYEWLTTQINIQSRGRPKEYYGLFNRLHHKMFVWVVPNDDNRMMDALDVRREFWGEGNKIPRRDISTLEVLVALSRRLEFNADRWDRYIWAGQLLKNLGLNRMYDPITIKKNDRIEEILETLLWRTYDPSGFGGFFPLLHPEEDQTKVEIWYQMSAYLKELSMN